MAIRTSRIEDNTHWYDIASGSGRENLIVYQDTTANQVALAKADALATSRAIGVIEADEGTEVQVSLGGDVRCVIETSITINPGDDVFLSNAEAGKVTNVAPTTGIIVKLGNAVRNVSSLIQITLNPREPIVL